MSDRGAIYFDISMERERQDSKWGNQSELPDPVWLTVLTEEVGEAAQEVLLATSHDASRIGLRAELIQVAAVAVAWIEAIDR